ncbi:Fpg/Nei family DNA glycosylase [Micropruina sonneratiae]|uniref:Fpg/Nei family DNA glycosylase n=1 Tax=Micropruina sonneratiae TaxID=2986940 RepID=UPI0022278CCA|nr:DNA-formamidopyrimidine glycosylase family protein [Micropruina sp. KQZ13P-5]MCW3158252.1 Fpg/Nei family DNA glycosylase [Micropruina sp. KQZ13P-5]
MPEGHVIHRLAGGLTQWFGGRTVRVSSPQGRFADEAASLDGSVLAGAEAYGKHLFVDFGPDRVVHIHLGLIGKLWLIDGEPTSPAGPDTLRLLITADARRAELRGPQWCRLITDEARDAVIEASGDDPIRPDSTGEKAWARISRSGRSIASLLMDQRITAGVGNIYRAEVLYRHRINPFKEGRTISRRTWNAIWADLVVLMRAGVTDGRIDTVRDEHLPEAMGRPPRIDRHGGEVYVYRRAGLPCLVCGTDIRTQPLEGRNLYWCPRCQRRR